MLCCILYSGEELADEKFKPTCEPCKDDALTPVFAWNKTAYTQENNWFRYFWWRMKPRRRPLVSPLTFRTTFLSLWIPDPFSTQMILNATTWVLGSTIGPQNVVSAWFGTPKVLKIVSLGKKTMTRQLINQGLTTMNEEECTTKILQILLSARLCTNYMVRYVNIRKSLF